MSQELAANLALETISVDTGPDQPLIQLVESQEKLEKWLPWAIYGVFVGLPLAASSLILALLGFFVAKVVIWLVRIVILSPMRNVRFDRAAAKLKADLSSFPNASCGPFSWTLGAPGAMVVTQLGEVVMTDRSTGYKPLQISAHEIADVQVKCNSQVVTDTRHSGRTTLGGFGRSFGMGYTLGGRSTSVTRSIDDYSLEIRYQRERNGSVSTAVIPGGSDHRVVEEICAVIRRLQP